MTTTTPESRADRFFDDLLGRQEAMFEAISRANNRYHRLVSNLVEGARQGGRDWAEMGRAWLKHPTDIVGLSEKALDAVTDGRSRSIALVRQWLEDLAEAWTEQREVQDRRPQPVQKEGEEITPRARTPQRDAKEPEPAPPRKRQVAADL